MVDLLGASELPVSVHRTDGPSKLFSQSLCKRLLDRNAISLAEDHGQAWVDVVLNTEDISIQFDGLDRRIGFQLTILLVFRATSLLLSLSSA